MYPITKEFDGITALAAWLEANKVCEGSIKASEQVTGHYGEQSWTNGVDFDQALTMAKNGGHWPEGAEKLMEAHLEVSQKLESPEIVEDYDVIGQTIDVAEYVIGNPECWVTTTEGEETEKPVLRVGMSADIMCNVTFRSMMYFGAAVLSVIDSLEAQGYRIELWASYGSTSMASGMSKRGPVCIFSTKLKDAAEAWSPSSVAFALAHSAFPRRLMFGVTDRIKQLNWLGHGGYGGTLESKDRIDDFDVYHPGFRGNISSAEEALAEVLETFKTQLNKGDQQ